MPGFITAKQLKRAIEQGERRLEPFRNQRRDAIDEYTGRFYGDNQAIGRRIINLVNRHITILAAHLTAGNPINDVRTSQLQFRFQALVLQLALGHLDEEIDRARISRRMLVDAMISPCMFARVGIRAGKELVTIQGESFDRGAPYYKPIALPNMVYDPSARCDDEALFMGEKYRILKSRAVESGIFKGYEDLINKLPTVSQRRSENKSEVETEEDSFAAGEMIELRDVAIYDDDITYMVTVPVGKDTPDEYLSLGLWNGPERGPFVKREIYPVPDSPFGIPPIAQAREQAELVNEMLEKLSEQVRNLKTILAYKPGHDDTVEAINKAKDGNAIAVEDPKADVVTLQMNQITQGVDSFAMLMLNLWGQQTGNIQVLGGDQGGADTATEYSGMTSSAGLMVGDIAREHERFETEVTKRLAFFLRTDPFMSLPLVKRLPGGELIEVRYTPDMMEDEHGDFTYKVRALSMRAETQDPLIRQRRLLELFTVIDKIAQTSAATGGYIDFPGSVRVAAREFGIEEMDEMVGDPMFAQFQQQLHAGVPGPSMGQPGGMSGGQQIRTSPTRETRGSALGGAMNSALPRNPAA